MAGATLADRSGSLAAAGKWLGARNGAQACAFLMFLLSGLSLDASQIRGGVSDFRVIAVSLAVIFVGAPLVALAHTLLPLDVGLRIGLLLIAIMPTTLSSGVVMAGLAGGNMATGLVVTVTASTLGIFTIPASLQWLLGVGSEAASATFDKATLAANLGLLVALPLAIGMGLRRAAAAAGVRVGAGVAQLSLICVLGVVWIATSRSHSSLSQAPTAALLSAGLAFSFHGLLLLLAVGGAKAARLGPGRREVVWFLGGQKTLAIAVVLQTALFSAHGGALVYCVVHHVVHLGTDAYLVGWLAGRRRGRA